jgi:hypothetical protein
MKFSALVVAVTFALSTMGSALSCQFGPVVDLNGNVLPEPTLEDHLADSRIAFVGTVRGFRNDATELVTRSIDCWHDPDYAAFECEAFLSTVISVVLSVDHAIKGIEAARFYEEYYDTGDGDCGPDFEFGKRYLYTDQFFGVEELADEPTKDQLAHWRAAALGK